MSHWSQLGFQDAFRPLIEEFHYFHDFTNMILLFILRFVGFMILSITFSRIVHKGLIEGQVIECIWTLVPGVILVKIALPSLSLLYLIEESHRPDLTVKAIGHQWFWEYEYSDFWTQEGSFAFDSYIIPASDLEEGIFRQLEADNRLILPYSCKVRILISRADVLHSWTVPALGVKADAIPGRINQLNFVANIPGVLYGQCSEICGRQHSHMPIALELIKLSEFNKWVSLNLNEWSFSIKEYMAFSLPRSLG